MQFRRYLIGPNNLSIAEVVSIGVDGIEKSIFFEVYEGTECIGTTSTLGEAVKLVKRMEAKAEITEDPDPDYAPSVPGGP